MNGSGLRQSAPAATPLDLRDEAVGGRIHQVDPAAVARLRKILAEKGTAPAKPAPMAAKASNRLNGSGFNNRLPKLQVAKEQKGMSSVLSDDEIVALHRRYVLENLAVSVLAEEIELSESAVVNQFSRLRLPCRARNRRWVSAADVEQVCQVHGLKIRDIPVRALPLPTKAAPTKAKPAKAVAPVAAVTEPVGNETAAPAPLAVTPPSPPTNGRSLELPAIHDQLAAVQQLMEMAQAKAVQVSGTIQISLLVDITL